MSERKTFTRNEVVEIRRNYRSSPWTRAIYQSEAPRRGHRPWHIVKISDDANASCVVVPINRVRKVATAPTSHG